MLKYICLSDMHAGALTSLLSILPGEEEKGQTTSPTTRAFQAALDGFLIKAGAEQSPPQLILLGDILDLQFSKRSEAYPSALGFLSALNEKRLLHPEVIATAGNHDHALWTDARLALDADTLRIQHSLSSHEAQPDYRASTQAFEKTHAAKSRLLEALLEEAKFKSCDLRYPNIGFGDTDRMVVLHHGHFAESLYRAMSAVMDTLLGTPRKDLDVDTLSAENAGWIDFAWASIGDAAGVGRTAEYFYQNFLTTTGYRRISMQWAATAAEALSELLPLSGNKDMQETIHAACKVALDVSIGEFRDTERYAIVDALSSEGLHGLRWYLEGPARLQIEQEADALSNDTTFIFGHTHKPFSHRIGANGYPSALKVYNTGGWVLNGPRLDNAEGAAMVLIDDKLNVASLRLFVTPQNGKVPVAHVEMMSDGREADAFRDEINDWLAATEDAWTHLAQTVKKAYEIRQAYLLKLTGDAMDGHPHQEAAE